MLLNVRQNSPLLFRKLAAVLALAAVIFSTQVASANEDFYVAPTDNSSPRATIESFMRVSNQIYDLIQKDARNEDELTQAEGALLVDELLRNLDLSGQPDYLIESFGKEGAACIKEILDRAALPPLDQIPDESNLGAESESGVLERWRVPGTVLELQRITEGEREDDYLFTAESIAKAIKNYDMYHRFPYQKRDDISRNFYAWYLTHPGPWMEPLVETLPYDARTKLIARQALWQWVSLTITLLVSFTVIVLAYYFGRKMGERRRKRSAIGYAVTLWYPILAMLVPAACLWFVKNQIRISGTPLTIIAFSANVVFLLASLVVINGIGSRIAAFIISRPGINEKGIDAQLIRIIARVLSLVLAIIVFLEGGKYLGIPLSTLLASAGVGGLAFALAAQESLKNFFGSIMIYMDKPFRIGQRIRVRDYDGVVEEIGLRSTRLRLLNGHQATIPNEEMARTDIENVTRRQHIRHKCDLRLPIDTPVGKVEKALSIVRDMLENHEGFEENYPPRAYFTDVLPDSLNLRYYFWYHPPEYWEYLKYAEALNLKILRSFEEEGIKLAVPLRIQQESPGEMDISAESRKEPEA